MLVKKRIAGILAPLFLAAAPGSVSAQAARTADQEPPAPQDSAIVVSGTAEDLQKSRRYVETLQMASFGLQVARWGDPVCLSVTGVPDQIGERLAGRIQATAVQVGVKIAPPGCKPNLVVVFTPDGGEFIKTTRQRSAARLREIPKRSHNFMYGADAPIRWWYKTDVMNRDGRPLIPGVADLVQCAGPCAMPATGSQVTSQSTYSSSIIQSPTIRQIKSTVVVIDVPLAAGRAIDSLGDYAALVGLAEIWPGNSAWPHNSILNLFEKELNETGEVPSLGRMDRRFLCELYRLPLDRSGEYQKGYLVRALSNDTDPCFGRSEGLAVP